MNYLAHFLIPFGCPYESRVESEILITFYFVLFGEFIAFGAEAKKCKYFGSLLRHIKHSKEA